MATSSSERLRARDLVEGNGLTSSASESSSPPAETCTFDDFFGWSLMVLPPDFQSGRRPDANVTVLSSYQSTIKFMMRDNAPLPTLPTLPTTIFERCFLSPLCAEVSTFLDMPTHTDLQLYCSIAIGIRVLRTQDIMVPDKLFSV